MPLARRRVLQAAILVSPLRTLWARSFWEHKKPAQWSAEEKLQLLSDSPWSRVGILRLPVDRKHGAREGSTTPVQVPGARPAGTPGGGVPVETVPFGEAPPPAPSDNKGVPPQFTVGVRWESAQPVQLAGGRPLPAETGDFYVILMVGMPLLKPRPAKKGQPALNPNLGMLDAIKRNSRLERKGKSPIACEHLLTGDGDRATELMLFFPKAPDPITPADKEVTLVSAFGAFELSVRFPVKEMTFGGALAL